MLRDPRASVMRVLVCGGRNYSNWMQLQAALCALDDEVGITAIIHGAATGADTMAGLWGKCYGKLVRGLPTEPGEGGYARNRRMLSETQPDLVVHFPGGNGTRDMCAIARDAGVRVHGGLAGPLEPAQRELL